MQKINFYILPIADFSNVEKDILQIEEVCTKIIDNSDTISLTDEFFSPDCNGNTIFNKLNSNSTSKFIVQYFSKFGTNSFDDIDMDDYHNQFIEIDNTHKIDKKSIVRTVKGLISCYQTNAYCLQDFSELFDWKRKCFPQLLFTEDSFGNKRKAFSINSSNPDFSDLYKQTVKCLSILNNQTKELVLLNTSERILALQAKLPKEISCSGKGRNEKGNFKKKVFVKDKVPTDINCHPHFKLIRGDSDYRIYFSWENEKIQSQTFIIAKIGSHWNDKDDSALSEIKIT